MYSDKYDKALAVIVLIKEKLDDDWCPECGWDWGKRPEPCPICAIVLSALERWPGLLFTR